MVSATGRPLACESLEGRYMMDSAFGQAVSEFVQGPTGDIFQRGPLIAFSGQQVYHNPDQAPPQVIREHALDAIFP
jgi:hypothetical protein